MSQTDLIIHDEKDNVAVVVIDKTSKNHESNGGLIADGYTRATEKMAMVIAQSGPGITGRVTTIKTADWNDTQVLLVTPQAANNTM